MTAAPMAALSPRDDVDVFISYAGKDRPWVHSTLRPRLERAELSVLTDVRDFDVGEAVFDNIYDAVARSRFMIAVLSPEWMDSYFTQVEGHFKLCKDLEIGARTLLPILRRRCEVPPYVKQISWVSLLEEEEDGEFESRIEGIIRTIKSKAVPAPYKAEFMRPAIDGLSSVLRIDVVRDAFERFRSTFVESSRQIVRMGDLKEVHDLLHKLQSDCLSIFGPLMPLTEDDLKTWPSSGVERVLALHADKYSNFVMLLKEKTDRPTFAGRPLDWLSQLDESQCAMTLALRQRNAAAAKEAVLTLKHVLAAEGTPINRELTDAAQAVKLRMLAVAIGRVIEVARAAGVPEAELAILANGARAMITLNGTVDRLVRDHFDWQAADSELRMVEDTLCESLDDLRFAWPRVKRKLGIVVHGDEHWVAEIAESRDGVESALSARDSSASVTFSVLRQRAIRRFVQVDARLLDQCKELRQFGRDLKGVLCPPTPEASM